MLRQTPPLEATEAFLAAADAASFRAASAQMALSPSAFSRRIQLLENFLGARLFDRSGQRAELTETGRRYLEAIQPAVEAIRRASADIRSPVQGSLRLAISHSLAVEWLMPRLGRLRDDLGITVDLTVTRDRQILRDQVDLAIWGAIEPDYGEGDLLVTLDAVPVASSLLTRTGALPSSVDELVAHSLLSVRSPANFWRQWLFSAGYTGTPPDLSTVYETNQMSYEAAAVGFGIALGVPLLVNRFLEDGRLQACARTPAPTGIAYWLHHANPAGLRNRQTKIFIDWLKAEALESKRRFMQISG